jgi:hypothetical protein
MRESPGPLKSPNARAIIAGGLRAPRFSPPAAVEKPGSASPGATVEKLASAMLNIQCRRSLKANRDEQ